MRRHAAWVALGLLLAVLEAELPKLPGLHTFHPLLHIPLILFFALRLNTIEGAVLSFVVGTFVGATVPYNLGLAEFMDVSIFVGARVLLAGIRADGAVFEAMFAFLLAAAFHLGTWWLRRLFGVPMSVLTGTPWVHEHFVACLSTAVATPFVFRIGRRIERIEAKPPGAFS